MQVHGLPLSPVVTAVHKSATASASLSMPQLCKPSLALPLLQSLEEALYKDQLREEAEYLDALDQQEIDIMIDSHMADEMRASPGGTPAVICPICHESGLVQRQGVILCPKRHLRIDIGIEGLGLEDVRQRLAGAYEVHAARGCVARPVFEQRGHLGMSSLFMHCGACGTLEVVL